MYAFRNRQRAKKTANSTGIPDRMRQRFEDMSGLSFGDVHIHYHSGKPAQRMAYAYTQGNQVYIALGKEQYLAHELGHVIQQKRGRVKPDFYLNGEAINESALLEREADSLAAAAERVSGSFAPAETGYDTGIPARQDAPVQRTKWRYRQETGEWDEEEEGEVPSPAPTQEEGNLLLSDAAGGQGPLRGDCVDTASYEYLCWLANKMWHPYGGHINHTLHSPGTTSQPGNRLVRNRLREMYGDGAGARNPREYGQGEDIHRFLRWLSTFFSVKYQITGEIQCYYDESGNRILVSTNLSREILKLENMRGKVATDYTAGMTHRQRRHMRHMYRIYRILGQSDHAFGGIRIRIVGDVTVQNAHAEQRILDNMRHEPEERLGEMCRAGTLLEEGGKLWLNPQYLGGIRRCCFACAYACIAPGYLDGVHPGAFWDSRASGVYMDGESTVRAVEGIRTMIGTHMTVQGSRATTEHDTDSDSEPETEPESAGEDEEEAAQEEADEELAEDMGNDLYLRIMDAFFRQ